MPRRGIATLALFAIVVLCLARVASVAVASPSGPAAVVAARGAHRLCFDHDGLEWIGPSSSFAIHLPEIVAVQKPPILDAWSAFETNGVHYDRPPPSA